ncbi:MAG: hypothetical protein IPN18_10060 [Ignavibacteriales bacterium]|nr:hypothetical protein [Ignavibacteriales bacterium]
MDQKNDVIGLPHAIDEYRVNPDLGTEEDVIQLKKILNEIGIALILDFVPNHFGSTSEILKNHPEIFLTVSEEIYNAEPHTYFTVRAHQGLYFAHGRDPFSRHGAILPRSIILILQPGILWQGHCKGSVISVTVSGVRWQC